MFSHLNDITRNAHLWLPALLRAMPRSLSSAPPKRVWLTIADHFEPGWNGADRATALRRVREWMDQWPRIAGRHNDATGQRPQYTFFFPEEQYRAELIDPLQKMTESGIADVEVHIHHDSEGEQHFVDRMSLFVERLHERHGLLRRRNGKLAFGFIHGNWALDNSHPSGRWCGLNNEITLLRDLGCYADFTLPSVPSATQTRTVNKIYWAKDDPMRPKSHDTGIPVLPGASVSGDLMMIPGPLALNWRERRRWAAPRTETGELAGYSRPTLHRAQLWLRHAPRIGDDVFVKLYSHGAPEKNAVALLGGDLDRTFQYVGQACRELGISLHFLTAWQMWNAIEALRTNKCPLSKTQLDVRQETSR
jgi:hypothetical protein